MSQEVKKTRKEFWMNFADGGGYPTMQFYREEDAREEAERLAKKTGKDVFLLHAVSLVRVAKPEPPVKWLSTVKSW